LLFIVNTAGFSGVALKSDGLEWAFTKWTHVRVCHRGALCPTLSLEGVMLRGVTVWGVTSAIQNIQDTARKVICLS